MPVKRILLFQPKAEEDLELIFAYTTSAWGIDQAEKYTDRLYTTIVQLLKNPEIGARYLTETNEYRKMVVDKHVIYYRNADWGIVVVRILHSKMNQDNWLK